MKITREEFNKSRRSIWRIADEAEEPEKHNATLLALLSDIHTMLEHSTVEPYEGESDW